jgi:hypothetical protein
VIVSGLNRSLLAALFAALLSLGSAYAETGGSFRGEFKFQSLYVDWPSDSLPQELGVGSHLDNMLNLRLMGNGQLGSAWSWDVAWVLDLRQGEGVELDRRLYQYDPASYTPPENRNWLDLQHTFTDKGDRYAAQRIDRLSLTYSGINAVLKVGRQALTWGAGLVFRPMDLFNPFPPNAVDTEYKPGSDMFYGQWLFDSGADIQGVVVPRRDPMTSHVEADQSAAGIKWHGFIGDEQQNGYEVLLARNYDEDVLGMALNGTLGGATWTAEAVPTRLSGGTLRTSWLANIQYTWTWYSRNYSGYAEYFHNGFGVGGSGNTLADLPAPLTERLDRGELFTVSRNYLTFGLTVEWTPLLNIKPMLITNLDDGSALLVVQAVRSLSENVKLTLALQSGLGPHGTEYGGLETAAGSGIYVTPDRYLYARIDWYF